MPNTAGKQAHLLFFFEKYSIREYIPEVQGVEAPERNRSSECIARDSLDGRGVDFGAVPGRFGVNFGTGTGGFTVDFFAGPDAFIAGPGGFGANFGAAGAGRFGVDCIGGGGGRSDTLLSRMIFWPTCPRTAKKSEAGQEEVNVSFFSGTRMGYNLLT